MADDHACQRRRELSLRIERATRLPMLFLSTVFLLVLAIPELVQVSEEIAAGLEVVGWLIWAVFAFELGVMTYLADDRRRYLMTHWADVLTVALPFLRPLRLLRVIILSLRVWSEAKELIRQRTFSVVAVTSLLCIWAAATLVYMAERSGDGPIETYADALWWAAATITTVGYGDVYPKTPTGRGIAFLLMLVGISVFGLLTARVAAFFVESDAPDDANAKLDNILARLERIERGRHLDDSRGPAPNGARLGARADAAPGARGSASPDFRPANQPTADMVGRTDTASRESTPPATRRSP